MTDIYNSLLFPQPEQDPCQGLSFDERIRLAVYQFIGYIFVVFITIILCALFSGCTMPKIIEQHHHHHYQADTLALQAQTDTRMTDTRSILDSLTRTLIEDYRASWSSHDDQRERITETVTTSIDSLGRHIRTEQRTTERTLSRQQQQSEQRLSQEFEYRLLMAIDSVNADWQHRFNAIQAHWEQSDTTTVQRGSPAADNRPWYKRWWHNLKDMTVVIVVLLLFTSRLWLPWCINLFRKTWKM